MPNARHIHDMLIWWVDLYAPVIHIATATLACHQLVPSDITDPVTAPYIDLAAIDAQPMGMLMLWMRM